MEITLEQSLAAAIRFIQDNASDGTEWYFTKIPENYYVPSVYFKPPYTAGRKATLRSWCSTITFICWFMEAEDWDAYKKVSDMRDLIMLSGCKIPVFGTDGEPNGEFVRVGMPSTQKIDDGIEQLSFEIEAYFHPEKDTQKAEKIIATWRSVAEKMDGGAIDAGS